MTNKQPEALRLADQLGIPSHILDKAAAELRRLHAENEALKQQIAATQPAAQRMEKDAARYRWLREQKPDVWKRIGWTTWPVDQSVMDARDDEIDQALAAQAKQGGA